MHDLVHSLATSLLSPDRDTVVVVTGAGISHASGIATFRGADPDAVWKSHDVSMATGDYFRRDPAGQWQWYLKRFDAVRHAEPNPAHKALVGLTEWLGDNGRSLHLVTQNIDTLHERAGSRDLIKVHGTSDRVRCSRIGCEMGSPVGSLPADEVDFSVFVDDPRPETVPTCPACGSLLRAHVLFFDEYYLEHQDYRFAEVEALAREADLLLFVGTSFSVGVTDLFLQSGRLAGIPMFSIDPTPRRGQPAALTTLTAPAEELLPAVLERLRTS